MGVLKEIVWLFKRLLNCWRALWISTKRWYQWFRPPEGIKVLVVPVWEPQFKYMAHEEHGYRFDIFKIPEGTPGPNEINPGDLKPGDKLVYTEFVPKQGYTGRFFVRQAVHGMFGHPLLPDALIVVLNQLRVRLSVRERWHVVNVIKQMRAGYRKKTYPQPPSPFRTSAELEKLISISEKNSPKINVTAS
jgi:hypothetical protein